MLKYSYHWTYRDSSFELGDSPVLQAILFLSLWQRKVQQSLRSQFNVNMWGQGQATWPCNIKVIRNRIYQGTVNMLMVKFWLHASMIAINTWRSSSWMTLWYRSRSRHMTRVFQGVIKQIFFRKGKYFLKSDFLAYTCKLRLFFSR